MEITAYTLLYSVHYHGLLKYTLFISNCSPCLKLCHKTAIANTIPSSTIAFSLARHQNRKDRPGWTVCCISTLRDTDQITCLCFYASVPKILESGSVSQHPTFYLSTRNTIVGICKIHQMYTRLQTSKLAITKNKTHNSLHDHHRINQR